MGGDLEETRKEEEAALAPAPPPLVEEPTAKRKAVVVAGGNQIPKADFSVVVEAAKLERNEETGEVVRHVKKTQYPAGADIYLRYDPSVQFPKDAAKVLTMGEDVYQLNLWGFTRMNGAVNVGPAHPAYAGANLAYQNGATDIVIVGLSDAEKEHLQVYFDALPNHPTEPALVSVSFA